MNQARIKIGCWALGVSEAEFRELLRLAQLRAATKINIVTTRKLNRLKKMVATEVATEELEPKPQATESPNQPLVIIGQGTSQVKFYPPSVN